MKLSYRDIEPFIRNPDPSARVILVYGPDDGLRRERAETIGHKLVGDLSDPFNVILLSGEDVLADPARFEDEARAISMMGGARLVRVSDATDRLSAIISAYLDDPSDETAVILEAGNLGPRSSLRTLCEKAKNAAALPCYVEDERDMSRLIRESCEGARIRIEPDAVAWLAAHITGDRQRARREIEKILLYANDQNSLNLEDVQACCGGAGARNLDDLIMALGQKNAAAALNSFELLCEDGVAFITILRSLQNHFRRLHICRAAIANGLSDDQAMKGLKPPVFFKHQPGFKAQLQLWSEDSLLTAMHKLSILEHQCKKTGFPPQTLCAQAVLGLSVKRAA